jgi:hypothetical protein
MLTICPVVIGEGREKGKILLIPTVLQPRKKTGTVPVFLGSSKGDATGMLAGRRQAHVHLPQPQQAQAQQRPPGASGGQ